MDKEIIEHIFESFYTTKETGKGIDLGLASVYGIVKSHGGNIISYSEFGQGTTFKIYLPAIKQTETAADKDLEVPTPQGGTETILLVDDEESIRDFSSNVFIKYGYAVLTASSGEEALEIYSNESNKIDLVLMDIGMPGIGGHKCFQEILLINPTAKVIIASWYSIGGQVKKRWRLAIQGLSGNHIEYMTC